MNFPHNELCLIHVDSEYWNTFGQKNFPSDLGEQNESAVLYLRYSLFNNRRQECNVWTAGKFNAGFAILKIFVIFNYLYFMYNSNVTKYIWNTQEKKLIKLRLDEFLNV